VNVGRCDPFEISDAVIYFRCCSLRQALLYLIPDYQKRGIMFKPAASFLIIAVVMVFSASCKKDEKSPGIPELNTSAITQITPTTAQSGGNITSSGGAAVTARGVCWSTTEHPSLYDNKTSDGTGIGSYASIITGLSANTKYYVRAYATNSKGTAYGSTMSFTTPGFITGSFTDTRDGNVYQTVIIGNKEWMAENLKYLPEVSGPGPATHPVPSYHVYGYNGTVVADAKATPNYGTYGVLYNWAAAMNGASSSDANPSGVQGACPTGWHLPSDAEWRELADYLGGKEVAGGKLKETDTTHWNSPNTGATNETGFTGLPGGFLLTTTPTFKDMGTGGYWWTATERTSSNIWMRALGHKSNWLIIGSTAPYLPYSIRCVKD
jgi:uncharacterized protein (TIGR02145 family)